MNAFVFINKNFAKILIERNNLPVNNVTDFLLFSKFSYGLARMYLFFCVEITGNEIHKDSIKF